MAKLESERKGWRNHYPVRMLWQSLIATKVYGIPTTNGLIRELRRTSVERVNSRLKKHLCLDDQHVRGLAKTTVNVGLSLLVMLGGALAMARNKKLDNLRQIVALAA